MIPIVFAALIAAALWCAWAFQTVIAQWQGLEWEIEKVGSWGDTFGALNAFFAAAAFIGLLITLRLQSTDQRRQSFDRTFFELLAQFRDEREHLVFRNSQDYANVFYGGSRKWRQGRTAISASVREARYWLRAGDSKVSMSKEDVIRVYNSKIHSRYENSLGPYFRIIYGIMDRIRAEGTLTEKEKDRYGNLLRAQLSSHEVGLAGLNGLAPYSKDMHDLITRFRLLKYLQDGNLKDTLKRFYPAEAFEGRKQSIPPWS